MLAVLYVRGAVIDFFRAERLIQKRPLRPEMKKFNKWEILRIKERLANRESADAIASELGVNVKAVLDLKPTLFKHERFVSLDRNLSDFAQSGNGGATTFVDVLPTPDVSTERDEQSHVSYMLRLARQDAELSKQEQKVIDLYFSDSEFSKLEVAQKMKMTQNQVAEVLQTALGKIRRYWPEFTVDSNSQSAAS